jgi:catalase
MVPHMLPPTKCFGVTFSDAERNLAAEEAIIAQIVDRVLATQANAAAQQKRPLARGTHAKGVCARAQFEVLDVTTGRDPALGARLAKGIYAKPAIYPAIVRFANADPNVNSDLKADVRSMSFSVELAPQERAVGDANTARQDYIRCRTLPRSPSTTRRRFWRL